ncbi:MAG: hypothetical protein HOP27_17240 [Anaerolineales bacterium]|nr:hypothetical protein [Anaerolineales bacterium]
MLNLPIVMFQYLLSFSLILFAQTAELSISSPQTGQILRGQVEITGNLDIPNFSSAELAFGYSATNPASNWFTIQTFPQPVKGPAIAVWDTSRLTDGDYILRLRVFFQDGTSQDVLVSDLKIRNDVPLPTNTPTATPTATPLITTPLPTSTRLPDATTLTFPSPMPLPSNPASLTVPSLYSTFGRGALIVFVLFGIFSLLLRLRRN